MCYDDHDYYPEGDARRCPRHPWVTTSSPDGMFDAPCGRCEYEMEVGEVADDEGPDQPPRADDPIVALRMGHPVYLSQIDDDIPF